MQGLEIKPYALCDKEGCINAFKTNVPKYFTLDEIKRFEEWLDYLRNAHSDDHYYVLKDNGLIIGCGGFSYRKQTNETTMTWGLIINTAHKKGYGRKLLEHRLGQISLLYPTSTILLDTTQFSFAFFEKYGFKVVKITKDHYALGINRYDMIRVSS